MTREQAQTLLEDKKVLFLLKVLRRRQSEIIESMRTCKPDYLPLLQGQDSFIETLFEDDFKEYVLDTYDKLRKK
jgi:hypothetical protein